MWKLWFNTKENRNVAMISTNVSESETLSLSCIT